MALFLFLLLALSRSSLVNLLRQSERLRASNRVGQLLSCLLHLGCNLGFELLRCSGRVGRQAFGGAHAHLPFLGTEGMELAKTLLASVLIKWIIFMGLVEVFLLLLKLSTILKHLTNLLGLQEVIRLTAGE
jgi:hypothetical protein